VYTHLYVRGCLCNQGRRPVSTCLLSFKMGSEVLYMLSRWQRVAHFASSTKGCGALYREGATSVERLRTLYAAPHSCSCVGDS
jgi:hypothetical protein